MRDVFMIFAILVLACVDAALVAQIAELKRSVELYPSVLARKLLETLEGKRNDRK